jgi:hypothetical protein
MSMFDLNNEAHAKFVATNREAWLQQATAILRPWFTELGLTVPEVKVSVGFSNSGGTKVIGVCFHPEASKDGVHQLFIHPNQDELVQVVAVLTHELLHAALPRGTGHRGRFPHMAKALLLDGKPTATVPSAEFEAKVMELFAAMPKYPHAALRVGEGKKQSTRQLKVWCPDDDYIVRMSQTQLDRRSGAGPDCPLCGVPMTPA